MGLVAHVWTALENDLDMWTYTANGQKMPMTGDGKPMGFRSRARFLKEIVRVKVSEPPKQLFIVTIDSILGVQDERDRLIHWSWGEDAEGNSSVAEWRVPKKTKDGFVSREIKVSVGRLIELSQNIDGYRATLADFIFKYGSRDGFILLSNAWRNMSRAGDDANC